MLTISTTIKTNLNFISILAIIVFCTAAFKLRDLKIIESKTSPKYKYLFRNGIYSNNKTNIPPEEKTNELAPVIEGRLYRPTYSYLIERNQYLVSPSVEPYQIYRHAPYAPDKIGLIKRHVLLDKNGQEIRHIDSESKELTSLDIGFNDITKIPPCISGMEQLTSLDLSHIYNITLPETMLDKKNLKINNAKQIQEQFPEHYQFLFNE